MILRALFWITVVGVLMPHEPDLGLGRPGTASSLPVPLSHWLGDTMAAPERACTAHEQGCKAALDAIDALQSAALRGLAEVKAEIEESQRQRALHGVNG